MIEKHYYLEDAGSPKIGNRYLIRFDHGDPKKDPGAGKIYRYSRKDKEWVTDREMLQIFSGGIPVTPISEEEANRIIEDHYRE